ncbi:MAG TPA: hypothetical protein VM099_12925 [Gemmatimonadaceae bacterium]|nr:hypothetical protein [Gemmatimonadaceae bacterium]
MRARLYLMACTALAVASQETLIAQAAAAPDSTVTALAISPDYAPDGWVDSNQPIGFRLNRPLDIQTERLALVVGRTDLSALFMVTPTTARYSANTLPLPTGETEITAYLVKTGQPWQELGKFPLRVRLRGGFRKAELKPGLTATTLGQVAPGTSRIASGVTFNPALRSTLVRDNGSMELQSNFLAVTHQNQALRFGARGTDAPKFDLSDYLIRTQGGPFNVSLGHLSYGANKHLISGFASRGITAGVAMTKMAELSLAALNGSSIVGWNNPVGLDNSDHRVYGASLKVEALPQRPGALLFDLSLLQGSMLPVNGFNSAEINDAERSRGWGFHFGGKIPGERITLDAGYAMSRFENPVDPTLSQNLTLVPVRPETKAARFADLSIGLLRDLALSKSVKANLTATFRHERVDPLYRSLAAAVQANALQNVVELTGGLGPVAVQASHARSEDNLDDIATVLKTFTHVTALNVGVPVASLFHTKSPLLPQLTYTLSRTRQFATDLPANSDFTETHVPDQVSANQSADLQWAIGKWKAAYRYNTSFQDNRQVGREKSDLRNLAHNISAGVSPMSWLDLGSTFSFEDAKNKELDQKNDTRRLGANVDVRATKDLALATVVSTTWLRDNPRTSESDNTELSAELSQNFRLMRARAERPAGRLFLRYQRQSANSVAIVNGVRGDPAPRMTWTLNSGVSLNAF